MKLLRILPLLLLVATTLLLQPGCSRLPVTGPLPSNLTATKIADLDEASPMAIAPDGRVVAISSSGLKLLHIPTRQQVEVSRTTPREVAWSPRGYSLAASYPTGTGSTIVSYDYQGIKLAETQVQGEITDLTWLSEEEILAASVTITNFKFGSNYKTVIHRWLPAKMQLTSTPLRDTTLQLATVRNWLPLLVRGPRLDLSRTADQILYVQPIDPPLFTPYYKLILRDLTSGRELELASVGMSTSGGRFTADGELVVYGNGADKTTVLDPWTDETVGSFKAAGTNLQISPTGEYRFSDGALYHGDKLVTMLAPGGIGSFTPDGRHLLLSAGKALYLLEGLQPASDELLPVDHLKKLLQPRAWRLEGIISPKEYKETRERITKP
jgi:hypothetical protein